MTVRHSSYRGLAAQADALLVLRLDEWCVDSLDSLHGIHVHFGVLTCSPVLRVVLYGPRALSVGIPHASQEQSAETIGGFYIDEILPK